MNDNGLWEKGIKRNKKLNQNMKLDLNFYQKRCICQLKIATVRWLFKLNNVGITLHNLHNVKIYKIICTNINKMIKSKQKLLNKVVFTSHNFCEYK